jgi:iron complex outermembrane recepter protein
MQKNRLGRCVVGRAWVSSVCRVGWVAALGAVSAVGAADAARSIDGVADRPADAATTVAQRDTESSQAAAKPRAEAKAPVLADATRIDTVRVNATIENDQGFVPKAAQTASKLPMRLLETPQSVSVITRELMESRQITNLQQALQTVAGVSPVNFGRRGFDDINVRGFRSSESILIDGLVQSPGMWTRLNAYGYERFEVLRGPASVLYGQIQPGGIVNAISKRPREEAFRELALEAGGFGLRQLGFDVNQPLSDNGRTALRLNAQAAHSDDPTDFVYRRDRWAAPSLSIDLGADADLVIGASYSQSEWLRQQGVTPFGTLLPNPNGPIPLSRFTGEPSFGPYDIEQRTFGWTFEKRFTDALVLRHAARYESEDGVGRGVFNATLQSNRRLQNRTATQQFMDYDLWATDSSLLTRFDTGTVHHQLVAGLDARHGTSLVASRSCTIGALDLYQPVYGVSASCPTALSSDAPSTLTVKALYAQDQLKFGKSWTALLGVRYDDTRDDTTDRVRNTRRILDDDATTWSFGLVNEFEPGWAAYASWGESFRPITGSTFAGAPFVPELGKQIELGVKHEALNGRITAALSAFELTRENLTTADPLHPGFSIQTGEQRARGIEFELAALLPHGVKLTSSYAYTDAEVTRDNNGAIVGLPVNLTPKHTSALWAQWTLPWLPKLALGLGGRHVSEQIGALPFTLPGYGVVDASLSYSDPRFRVTFGVKNLTDRTYYDGAINANVVSPGLPRIAQLSWLWFF